MWCSSPGRTSSISQTPVAGGLSGAEAMVSFSVPVSGSQQFLKLRAGTDPVPPPSLYSGPAHFNAVYSNEIPLTDAEKAGHVLNRLGYGVSPGDLQRVSALGVASYIEEQLNPETIDESANAPLHEHEAALFSLYQPGVEQSLVRPGDLWRYFKGTQEPPMFWKDTGFNDASWMEGPSGFGYGDDDDATVLEDMRQTASQPGYLSLFLRTTFDLPVLDAIDQLVLRVDFDDGFVAYLNGFEVAREGVAGNPPTFDEPAEGHEAGSPLEFDLTPHKALLQARGNVLAVQLHNTDLGSSDATIIPELISRTHLPIPPLRRIKGLPELQQLVHVYGIDSRRQLQAVLAEFWDNHFTTDYDKVFEYFDGLRTSDARDAMSDEQAAAEAAQAEYEEFQFFFDNALGNFGDLLLYSATSPTMLIYLDSVLNRKAEPNENYAREILELFAFGVDNRYNQADIEQLAKCFTGWTVRKVALDQRPSFPASARTPPTTPGVQFEDLVFLNTGPGWKYFKGTREPAPDASGAATLRWAEATFDDSAWLDGATSIGFGDNDDATVLSDMRNNYVSVYLRRSLAVSDPASLGNLLLDVDYDDGFVAYLNGVEVARSDSMENAGTPPRFNATARAGREALRAAESFSLKNYLHLLRPFPEKNVLAIQVHNISLSSSDLSIHPRLIVRELLPGSIENSDPNGAWTFRFDPDEHDLSAKTLFPGTPYEIRIPANRTGLAGLMDATEVIDALVRHPSTREFICLKLINKFVSDQITLESYRNGTAPAGLRQLMDDAMAAWVSTNPQGHIRTVLRAILNPAGQSNYFWTGSAYRSKIKTPVEFINSSLRALQADGRSDLLPTYNDRIGMRLFDRDMPDGWSELGFDWMDTGGLLERIKFVQTLSGNSNATMTWNLQALLRGLSTRTAEAIVDHFDRLFFQGSLSASDRALFVRFVSTDPNGAALPLDPNRNDFTRRVQELVGLMLSAPQWHNQ